MNTFHRLSLSAALAIGVIMAGGQAFAQDCDAMIGEVDQLLETANLTQEQKDQVMDLRDQAMGETTRAGGDCTTPLSQALDILKGNN